MSGLFLLLLSSLAVYANAGFPTGRCYVPTCEASPYDLTWVSQTDIGGGNVRACFNVTSKPCIDDAYRQYGCCGIFNNLLYKIVLASQPSCAHSVKAVYLNGVKRGGGIYFDNYEGQHSELRITNLNIPGSNAPGKTFCIDLAPPCASIADFCVEERSQLCKFSIFDTGAHQCCPTCYMLDKSQSNSQLPTPTPTPNQAPGTPPQPDVPSPDPEFCQSCCNQCSSCT